MEASLSVPFFVVVNHHSNEISTPTRTRITCNTLITNVSTRKHSTRLHKRVVSDISVMLSVQEQPQSPMRNPNSKKARFGSYYRDTMEVGGHPSRTACHETKAFLSQNPVPTLALDHNDKTRSSYYWFLPLGRPLAAPARLLSAKPGTAISAHDACRPASQDSRPASQGSRKRRQSKCGERKNRRKVGPCFSSYSDNEGSDEDAAATLSKLCMESIKEESPSKVPSVTPPSAFVGSALPPPPFQLFQASR